MDHITHLFIFSFNAMKKITTFIFFLLLISPILGTISGFGNEQLNEKRELVKLPDFSANNLIDPAFYSNIEKYYNDQFVYRGELIKAKSLIDYYVFNTSITSKVYIGTNEWLYLREELPDYIKDGCSARDDMRGLARQISRMETILLKKGKKLIFIVPPNKSTIYPEYVGLPHSYTGCKSKYEYLLEAFKQYPVKGFIRLDDTLLQAKKEKQLYYKDDTHWNVNGAMVASIKILKYLRPLSWDKDLPEVEVIKEYKAGDLANMMSINLGTKESVAKHINFTFKIDKKTLEPEDQIHPKFEFKSESFSNELIPRTIILQDSFMSLPLEFIKGSFEQLDTYWWGPHLSDPRVVEDLQASKVIVIECVERYLGQLGTKFPIIISAIGDQDK